MSFTGASPVAIALRVAALAAAAAAATAQQAPMAAAGDVAPEISGYTLYAGMDVPSYEQNSVTDLQRLNLSPTECAAACSADPMCDAFVTLEQDDPIMKDFSCLIKVRAPRRLVPSLPRLLASLAFLRACVVGHRLLAAAL